MDTLLSAVAVDRYKIILAFLYIVQQTSIFYRRIIRKLLVLRISCSDRYTLTIYTSIHKKLIFMINKYNCSIIPNKCYIYT